MISVLGNYYIIFIIIAIILVLALVGYSFEVYNDRNITIKNKDASNNLEDTMLKDGKNTEENGS